MTYPLAARPYARSRNLKMVVLGLLGCAPLFANSFECSDILRDGLRNTFQELRVDNFDSEFSRKYCAADASSSDRRKGMKGEGTSPKFMFKFGSASRGDNRNDRQSCDQSRSDIKDGQLVNAMRSVADPGVVNAWRECVAAPIGLTINGTVNDRDLVLRVFFRNAGNFSSATLLPPTTRVSGATCEPDDLKQLAEGQVIKGGGVELLCKRRSKREPVTVVANSDFGPAHFVLPIEERLEPEPPPPPPAPVAKKTVCHALAIGTPNPGTPQPRCETSFPVGTQCTCKFPGVPGTVMGVVIEVAQ